MSHSIQSDPSRNSKPQAAKTPHSAPFSMAPNIQMTTRARSASTDSTVKSTNDDETVFFETITMTKFDKFQARIFPVISAITVSKQHQEHPFSNLWKQALKAPGHAITSESTFRSIHKVLPVENLQDYRRFLLECPSINDYLTFKDSNQTTPQ